MCLDPAVADEMTLSDEAKTEIILAGMGTFASMYIYNMCLVGAVVVHLPPELKVVGSISNWMSGPWPI